MTAEPSRTRCAPSRSGSTAPGKPYGRRPECRSAGIVTRQFCPARPTTHTTRTRHPPAESRSTCTSSARRHLHGSHVESVTRAAPSPRRFDRPPADSHSVRRLPLKLRSAWHTPGTDTRLAPVPTLCRHRGLPNSARAECRDQSGDDRTSPQKRSHRMADTTARIRELNLYGQYFDLVASGTKTIEVRVKYRTSPQATSSDSASRAPGTPRYGVQLNHLLIGVPRTPMSTAGPPAVHRRSSPNSLTTPRVAGMFTPHLGATRSPDPLQAGILRLNDSRLTLNSAIPATCRFFCALPDQGSSRHSVHGRHTRDAQCTHEHEDHSSRF